MDDYQAGLLVKGIDDALRAAGIPIISVGMSPGNTLPVIVTYSQSATPAQIAQGDAIVAAYGNAPRVKRNPLAVYADLLALTAQQKTNVWNDLSQLVTVGTLTVKKYLTDTGPSYGAISAHAWAAEESGAVGAALTSARMRIATIFVLDNPAYLVHPAFDPSVNVPGDQPVS